MNKKKERLIKIIKRAENAYSDKEQMVNELQSLKKESQREQEEFEKECDKLNQMMLKDRQIRDYIKTKEETKVAQI